MLYLGTTILILLDLSYLSRFWTQFEAWLSMQFATPDGLRSAVGTANSRHHIVCIQNAAPQREQFTSALTDTWANKTPQEAHDFLSSPDVQVTNASDKRGQLPKIKSLGVTVQTAFEAIDSQLQQQVAATADAAAHAKAALHAFERKNDVKAGDSNPVKRAATQAESEAAAARAAKEKHAQAVAHGVMPMVMEREEGRRIVEEARKAEAEARAAEKRARAAKAAAAAEARAAKEKAAGLLSSPCSFCKSLADPPGLIQTKDIEGCWVWCCFPLLPACMLFKMEATGPNSLKKSLVCFPLFPLLWPFSWWAPDFIETRERVFENLSP